MPMAGFEPAYLTVLDPKSSVSSSSTTSANYELIKQTAVDRFELPNMRVNVTTNTHDKLY